MTANSNSNQLVIFFSNSNYNWCSCGRLFCVQHYISCLLNFISLLQKKSPRILRTKRSIHTVSYLPMLRAFIHGSTSHSCIAVFTPRVRHIFICKGTWCQFGIVTYCTTFLQWKQIMLKHHINSYIPDTVAVTGNVALSNNCSCFQLIKLSTLARTWNRHQTNSHRSPNIFRKHWGHTYSKFNLHNMTFDVKLFWGSLCCWQRYMSFALLTYKYQMFTLF